MCPLGLKCKLKKLFKKENHKKYLSLFLRHILGKKTPRVPGPKFQKEKKSKNCLANNQSFRCNNKAGPGSHNAGRRASTSVQFGGNTNMEETWTSISQRWPTWQLFRSVLLSIVGISRPRQSLLPLTINHFQAKCTTPSVADGEWYHPTVAQ